MPRADQRPRPGLLREVILAAVGGLLVTVVCTWPAVKAPFTGRIAGDLGDPLLQVWQVAWDGHALLHQPLHFFDSNTFWPSGLSLAFSDALIGYTPAGLLGSGPGAAVVRYGLLVLLAFWLAFVGAYLLARQLRLSWPAAALAGVGFAVSPWRFSQIGHLHVLSSGGIALALALLLRGHAGLLSPRSGRPDRPGVALLGWLVAAWQISLGFGIGLPFGYLLGIACLIAVAVWWRRGAARPSRRLLVLSGTGLAVFVLVSGLLAIPYLLVVHQHPEARRTVADLRLFSPPLRAFAIVPDGNRLWGSVQAGWRAGLPFPPEMTLAPGLVLTVLAAVGVLLGRWSLWARAALVVTGGVLLALALGTSLAGGTYTYLPLLHLPGWDGLRTPGRLVLPLTLVLAVLAGLGLDALRGLLPRRAGAMLATVVVALAVLEGATQVDTPPVPPPVDLTAAPQPMLVLTPSTLDDTQVMTWTTHGFPLVVNGISGFVPTSQAAIRAQAEALPAPAAVSALRADGLASLVLPLRWLPDPAATERAYVEQGLTVREIPGALVVRLH